MPNDPKINPEDYQGTSLVKKTEIAAPVNPPAETGEQRKPKPKMAKGTVVVKKKGWLAKLSAALFDGADDPKAVGDHLLYNLFIPAAKDTLSDLLTNTVEIIFWGEPRSRGSAKRRESVTKVSYSDYYTTAGEGGRRMYHERDQAHYIAPKDRYRFEDIVFKRERDAVDILADMENTIREFGWVPVSDFMNMAGQLSDYNDYNWGWEDLRDAQIGRRRDGWYMIFPPIVPANRR